MSLSTLESWSKNRWRLRKNVGTTNQVNDEEESARDSQRGKSYGINCEHIMYKRDHFPSHSGLLELRGTSTVRKDPGVRDITTWSVMP